VNCAALPETLWRSELFGHAKGASPGRTSRELAAVREADGGTLFLDEIGEMPLALQAKLLVSSQEARSDPWESTSRIDRRRLVCYHRNLGELAQLGSSGPICTIASTWWPLDLPRCVTGARISPRWLDISCAEPTGQFSAEATPSLERYPWPGNVARDENVIARLKVEAGKATSSWRICPQASRRSPLPRSADAASRQPTGVRSLCSAGDLEDA